MKKGSKDKKRKSKVMIVKATQDHIDSLTGRLREADKRELYDAFAMDADYGLRISFENSRMCWVGIEIKTGIPFCAFGVYAISSLSTEAEPWLLGTDAMGRLSISALRESKKYVQKMLKPFELLHNYVDCRNTVSINWLKWCGFTMEDPRPFGTKCRMFSRFYLKNDNKTIRSN